jgi:DNA-binding XRE family transcriptional regulator
MAQEGLTPMQAQHSRGKRADLGRAVRDARNRRDMTQEALALESGLQRKTVYMIEVGKSDPRLGALRRIARAVNVQVAVLLDPAPEG